MCIRIAGKMRSAYIYRNSISLGRLRAAITNAAGKSCDTAIRIVVRTASGLAPAPGAVCFVVAANIHPTTIFGASDDAGCRREANDERCYCYDAYDECLHLGCSLLLGVYFGSI